MKIAVCCPSYKRPKVKTQEYIPFCRVYVDAAEAEAYKAENPADAQIVICENGVQGNLCRVRNYILRKEFEAGADAVCIVDDDMSGLYLWVDGGNHIAKKRNDKNCKTSNTSSKWKKFCRFWKNTAHCAENLVLSFGARIATLMQCRT